MKHVWCTFLYKWMPDCYFVATKGGGRHQNLQAQPCHVCIRPCLCVCVCVCMSMYYVYDCVYAYA